MAIDSETKRRSSLAAVHNRLPWGMAFGLPSADGDVDVDDRYSLGGAFAQYIVTAYGDTSPFGIVYARLWELLLAQASIATGVKAGNRIDYTQWNTRKQEVLWSDFPMLIVIDGGTESQDTLNSSQAAITRTYQIGLLTGGDKINDAFYDLDWAIFRALTTMSRTFPALTYEGHRFVGDATFGEGTDIELGQDFVDNFDGGHLTWATTYNFEVMLSLNHKLI